LAAVTKGFLDLADLVASDKARKGVFDELAYSIGKEAYADLNGWHLFLKDMTSVPGGPKMQTLLAEQLGTQVCLLRPQEVMHKTIVAWVCLDQTEPNCQ
jgi:hypothetical protein